MADLSWFPHTPAKWRHRTAGLSPLARAAYHELLDHAWEAASRDASPCTLPANESWLANMSGFGPLWKKVGAEVRSLYTVTDTGLLLDGWLLAIWEEQQQKHAAAVVRARAGGYGKAEKERAKRLPDAASSMLEARSENAASMPKARSKHASSTPQARSKHADREGAVLPAPNGARVVLAPASNGALAPVGAALRAADVTGGAERSARRRKLEDEYAGRIGERFKAWTARNSDEAASLESIARADLALPDGELLSWQSSALAAAVLQAWRQLPRSQPIPSCDEWVAEREASEWIPDELMAEATS